MGDIGLPGPGEAMGAVPLADEQPADPVPLMAGEISISHE